MEHPLQDLKMRMEYFYGITIIREMTDNEKLFFRKTVKELSLQDSTIKQETKDFLHILAGYLSLICTTFFPSLTDEALPFVSDSESEKE
jgi:hypothetical protein